jgi:hypothetical protein
MNLGPMPTSWEGPLWVAVILHLAALGWLLVQLHRWLSRRGSRLPAVVWDRKKGWNPWWLLRK